MNIYCICLPVFISFSCDFRLLSEATQKYSFLLRLPVATYLSQDFFRNFKEDETSWQCPPVLFYREIMRVNAIFPSAQLSGLDLRCRFDIGVMTSVAGNPLLTLNSEYWFSVGLRSLAAALSPSSLTLSLYYTSSEDRLRQDGQKGQKPNGKPERETDGN